MIAEGGLGTLHQNLLVVARNEDNVRGEVFTLPKVPNHELPSSTERPAWKTSDLGGLPSEFDRRDLWDFVREAPEYIHLHAKLKKCFSPHGYVPAMLIQGENSAACSRRQPGIPCKVPLEAIAPSCSRNCEFREVRNMCSVSTRSWK